MVNGTDILNRDVEYVTVRITEDVGEIFCVDEEIYELTEGDVVDIPLMNANPLFDNGTAYPVSR